MNKPKFLRTSAHKYSKLGVRRKNKQIYRKAKGRDNKIRLNKAGRLRKVKIGFRTQKNQRNLIKEKKPIIIMNLEDLKKIKPENIGIVGKIGNKKKKQIAEQAKKENIKLANLNLEKFLKKLEEKTIQKKEKKKKIKEKKQARDKKSKEKTEDKKKEKSSEEKPKEDKTKQEPKEETKK